jgi:hypothetical protein
MKTDSALEQLLACEPFSKRRKARLRHTEHPNALPTSWHCPSQPRTWFGESFSIQHARFALGQGCDRSNYVAKNGSKNESVPDFVI